MTRKKSEKKIMEEINELSDYLAVSETSLSVLGYSSAMASGQSALSSAVASGRTMQNATIQAQNSHNAFNAQTSTGVASILKKKRPISRHRRIRNFIELKKAL